MCEQDGKAARVVMLRLGYSSPVANDSRVLREAYALSKCMNVRIFDIVDGVSKKSTNINGVSILLLPLMTKRLPKTTIIWFFKYCEYFFRTLWTLLGENVDIIHAHDLDTLPAGWLAGRLKGGKIIYDAHELFTEMDGQENVIRKVWRKIERFLIRRVDGVIAANDSRARIMYAEYGATEKPTSVMNIPNKTDVVDSDLLRRFVSEKGAPYGYESKIVLYQGGFSPLRGLEELVNAFKHIPDAYVLVLMGYGGLKDALLDLIGSTGLKHRVFLHAAVPSGDLHPYTCSADLGVITYKNTCRNKFYCAPNKMFEYIMAGLPVIGADLPEIRSIINKYGIGCLFDPESPKSINKAIMSALDDQTYYEQIKTNLKGVAEEYCWENEEKKLCRLYERVVGR